MLRHDLLQVWIPTLGPQRWEGVVARDAQRAFAAWRGEDVVFLLPKLRHEHRWQGWGTRFLALPETEHLDVLHVVHVGPTGGAWPFALPQWGRARSRDKPVPRFPGGSVDHLLQRWIAPPPDQPAPEVALLTGPITLWVPAVRRGHVVTRAKDGAVGFEQVSCEPGPGPAAKMTIKRSQQTIRLQPIGVRASVTISPDAESLTSFCPSPTSWHGMPGSIGPDGLAYPRFLLLWQWPWSGIMSLLDAFDPVDAQGHMRTLLMGAKAERAASIREARARVAPLASEAMSTLGLARFWPTYTTALFAAGDGPLVAFWEDWFTADTLDEARRHPRLDDPVPVLRVWGSLGLLWTLCREELESRAPRACLQCGWLLMRTKRQRWCGPSDNPACYRKRQAAARRQQRDRSRERR